MGNTSEKLAADMVIGGFHAKLCKELVSEGNCRSYSPVCAACSKESVRKKWIPGREEWIEIKFPSKAFLEFMQFWCPTTTVASNSFRFKVNEGIAQLNQQLHILIATSALVERSLAIQLQRDFVLIQY